MSGFASLYFWMESARLSCRPFEALCTVLMCTTMYHHIVCRRHCKFDCGGVRAWQLVIVS
jgi:hypothetical protein